MPGCSLVPPSHGVSDLFESRGRMVPSTFLPVLILPDAKGSTFQRLSHRQCVSERAFIVSYRSTPALISQCV